MVYWIETLKYYLDFLVFAPITLLPITLLPITILLTHYFLCLIRLLLLLKNL